MVLVRIASANTTLYKLSRSENVVEKKKKMYRKESLEKRTTVEVFP
jgi:hypothetical protein